MMPSTFTLSAASSTLQIDPGGLLRLGEAAQFTLPEGGCLVLKRGLAGDFAVLAEKHLAPGEAWVWQPEAAGMYLLEWREAGEPCQRPLAVAKEGWAVCQVTVGAVTAEDFAEILHPAGLAADYYVSLPQPGRSPEFSATDPRWRDYERRYADALHPHVMAGDIGRVVPGLACDDPNWEHLDPAEITAQLLALRGWWEERGYRRLDRLASYTPCNALVRAMEENGFRILHSLIPEQNWSDGEWAINHWGMPNCPFWIAGDDFRKAGRGGPEKVLGMSMNFYHVLLPHLTRWGDFVLSPSHFARWIRSADAGEEPVRYLQFLRDLLAGWISPMREPFFFTAGFEFGRTFGTRLMTHYNRRGLEALVDLSRTEKLVFATSPDVLAYYDRHLPEIPPSIFRQRDYWFGLTTNGKPAAVGDSIVIENASYKAALREEDPLPVFLYDYRSEWQFEPDDPNAPEDHAKAIRQALKMAFSADGSKLLIEAAESLPRAVPVGLWDASAVESPFPCRLLPLLDDRRSAAVLEIPRGWSGKVEILLRRKEDSARRTESVCQVKTFGTGERLHTYVNFAMPLVKPVSLEVDLRRDALAENAHGEHRRLAAGRQRLSFEPFAEWYRFAGCTAEDIQPVPESIDQIASNGAILPRDWPQRADRHARELRAAAVERAAGRKLIHETICGGRLGHGMRSRARESDLVYSPAGLEAAEFGDGALALGPGKSFWYHPRFLTFKIQGLDKLPPGPRRLVLNTFDPFGIGACYRLFLDRTEFSSWTLPTDASSPEAWRELALPETASKVSVRLVSDQTPVLEHWWREKGFIAALHALWIFQ